MEELIAALYSEMELTAEEIADVFWLALIRQQSTSDAPARAEIRQRGDDNSRKLGLEKDRCKDKSKSQLPRIGIFSKGSSVTAQALYELGAKPFKVVDPPSIRNPLALARALRPLMRYVPSGIEMLDESATVQRIAEEQLWIPVTHPTLDPWLDLALVIDSSSSMLIWQRTISELQSLLSYCGVFRNVRTWSISVEPRKRAYDSEGNLPQNDEQKVGVIRPGFGKEATQHTPRHPKELIDPNGRRLILVVTDCVSSMWYEQAILNALKLWADHGLMAIVQMLPEWLWTRTALRTASKVQFYGLEPGTVNQQLSAVRPFIPRSSSAKEDAQNIQIPILTLESTFIETWSQMVAGRGNVLAPGFVFNPAFQQSASPKSGSQDFQASAKEKVQNFKVASSPMARQLASLLAASPVINLPVVRLIRETMLPKSQQVHVAEVLLGGLLQPTSQPTLEMKPDDLEYRFQDEEIRRLLLEGTPVPDMVRVLSTYVQRQFGRSLKEFIAELQVYIEGDNEELVERVRPFAQMTAEVLRRRGGSYAEFVQKVEQHFKLDESTGLTDQAEVPDFTESLPDESQGSNNQPQISDSTASPPLLERIQLGLSNFAPTLDSSRRSVISRFGRRVKTKHSLRAFTVQIWHRVDWRIIGTGFFFQPEGKILTCAHVVRDASVEDEVALGVEVRVRFNSEQVSSSRQQEYRARVVETFHQIHNNYFYDDIVVIELIDAPVSLISKQRMARLEPAYHPGKYNSSGNPFRSYGYSSAGQYLTSAYADGEILGPIEGPAEIYLRAHPLELRSDSITRGMSGAAILDMKRDRVVGIITHQLSVQGGALGRGIAFGADAKIVLL
ncbi:MAG: trypsin-like peptidase domain-containing protein [Leptolyngbyaceae cyanobacterium RM1_406_9]|nr:trypsin-like peptidase domain-containing protein [Leptolyngbyaceae cyanobacterium RM1_406_9]